MNSVSVLGGFLRSGIFAKLTLSFVLGAMLLASMPSHAQRSRRVLRDLAVQKSEEIGAVKKVDQPVTATATTSKDGQLPAGTALSIGWMASTGHPVPATAVTGVIAPTGTNQEDQQAMQALQGLMGAITGQGGAKSGGSTGTAAAAVPAAAATTTQPASSSPSTSSSPTSSDSSGSKRDDAVDPNKPLPSDTSVDGRDCSATRKTWQPFTKHPFKINSCFGQRESTHSHHNGLDVGILKQPQSVNPVAPGKIAAARSTPGYGCEIIIEHESCPAGMGGTKCYSQYAHLKKDKNGKCPAVGRTGEAVNPCTELALMGNTGASQAPHLHFEVRTSLDSKSAQDPNKVFKEYRAHKNYQKDSSTCGTVGDRKAPARETPVKADSHGHVK